MVPRKKSWIDSRVEVLLAVLNELGLSLPPVVAKEQIEIRVRSVASQLRINPTSARAYLTDDVLISIAQSLAFDFADETPGADFFNAPRNTAVPLATVSRCVAGLAEAIQIRLRERDDVEHTRVVVGHLAETISAIDLLTIDYDEGFENRSNDAVLVFPAGLINRAARYLEACSSLIIDDHVSPARVPADKAEQLAAVFAQDAADLRSCVHD